MSALEALLGRLDRAQKTAVIDPDAPEYSRTKSGIAVAVQQAKEEVAKVRAEYEQAVLQLGVAIFLFGPPDKTREFAALVSDMGEAVSVDASALYTTLAKRVEPSIGPGRNFSSEQIAHLHAALADVSADIGVRLTRPIKITRQELVQDFAATVNYVRETLRDNFGDDLNAQSLKRALGQEGLKIRYMGSTCPVIILNALHEEALGLGQLFGKGRANVELTPEDTIDKEFIVKTFSNVKKQLKK